MSFVFQLAVLSGAIASGCLHAVGMALRKKYGEGSERYFVEPGWWAGLLLDILGGVASGFVSPLMAVEIMIPVASVSQLASAYLCGIYLFQERSSAMQQLGFVMSVAGVVLLGGNKQAQAKQLPDEFWLSWLQPDYLLVNLFWLLCAACCFAAISAQNGYAVLSSYADGLQFLFTRYTAGVIEAAGSLGVAFWLLVTIKMILAIVAIHWQQLALGADLSSIGTTLSVVQIFTTASLGCAFFRDQVEVTPGFLCAVVIAPTSVWLLAQSPDAVASIKVPGTSGSVSPSDIENAPKKVEASDYVRLADNEEVRSMKQANCQRS